MKKNNQKTGNLSEERLKTILELDANRKLVNLVLEKCLPGKVKNQDTCVLKIIEEIKQNSQELLTDLGMGKKPIS